MKRCSMIFLSICMLLSLLLSFSLSGCGHPIEDVVNQPATATNEIINPTATPAAAAPTPEDSQAATQTPIATPDVPTVIPTATPASTTAVPTTAVPTTPNPTTPNPTTPKPTTPKPTTPKPTTAKPTTPKPTTPKPTATPIPTLNLPEGSLKGVVIGIDPGHQGKSNSEQEPVSPGSSETKKKVSSGTQGVKSRVPEYEVVLKVGLLLKAKLEQAGATVIMTRETNNVNISNAERAIMMNEANADLVLRIHCDGSTNSSVQGASMLIPAAEITKPIREKSKAAGEVILKRFIEITGAKNKGLVDRTDLTGFNWSTVPTCLIEMGYMSNETEDRLLTSADYQEKCAEGLYQGILLYFH